MKGSEGEVYGVQSFGFAIHCTDKFGHRVWLNGRNGAWVDDPAWASRWADEKCAKRALAKWAANNPKNFGVPLAR